MATATITAETPAVGVVSQSYQALRLERRWLQHLAHQARADGDTELADTCQKRLVAIGDEINRRMTAGL